MAKVQQFICEEGNHPWSRPSTRGKPPRRCPEHRTNDPVRKTPTLPMDAHAVTALDRTNTHASVEAIERAYDAGKALKVGVTASSEVHSDAAKDITEDLTNRLAVNGKTKERLLIVRMTGHEHSKVVELLQRQPEPEYHLIAERMS